MLDRDQVKKVAHLARLQLTEQEETQFTSQLSEILGYFEQLSELNTSDVEPTARAIEVSNVTRVDRLQPYPHLDTILNEAPEQEERFFRVPKIMDEAVG